MIIDATVLQIQNTGDGMSSPRKIAEWSGNTDSHIFEVKFFEDEEQGVFIAKFEAKSLSAPRSRRNPGKPPLGVDMPDQDRLRDEVLEVLIARSRAHIKGRYGEIRNLREKTI